MLKIGVIGASGKMGSRVCHLAKSDPDLVLIHASEKNHLFQQADLIIDFSSHLALDEHLKLGSAYRKPLVIGTTGHSDQNISEMKEAGSKIPVLFSPNFSIGIALLNRAIKEIYCHPACTVEIIETHHSEKKDAPSGTARLLAANFKDAKVSSIREGNIIGEHTVILQYEGERIELTHRAESRDIFALGALRAAKFLSRKSHGFYTLQETLSEIHDGGYGKG